MSIVRYRADRILKSVLRFRAMYPTFVVGYFFINNYDGQEAYSQTGTSGSLPYLWRRTGRKMRTLHGTATHRASS
jgi:hypothetical protein